MSPDGSLKNALVRPDFAGKISPQQTDLFIRGSCAFLPVDPFIRGRLESKTALTVRGKRRLLGETRSPGWRVLPDKLATASPLAWT